MDPDGSFVSSQKPATGPYPKPDDPVQAFPYYFLKIHFNTNFPPIHPFRAVSFLQLFQPKPYYIST